MIRQPTTFIIGAGASCDLGFPLGETFKDQIIEVLRHDGRNGWGWPDNGIRLAVERVVKEGSSLRGVSPYAEAARAIALGLPMSPSIDTFIENRGDPAITLLSKLAIAAVILRAERSSYLAETAETHEALAARDTRERRAKLGESWITQLGYLVFGGHTRASVGTALSDLSFIVFNYDRALEFFLYRTFTQRFGMPDQEAADLIHACTIVHPYGQCGELLPGRTPAYVPYGQDSAMILPSVAQNIKTFSEAAAKDIVKEARRVVYETQRLVFLGFGWHEQNMRLLTSGNTTNVQSVYASSLGIHADELRLIGSAIGSVVGKQLMTSSDQLGSRHAFDFVTESATSREFMDHIQMRLTRG